MSIISYLEHSESCFPNKIAFEDANKSITYNELLLNAQHIATYLLQKYEANNSAIAVLIDRNIESINAFMGIAMSRNFYVPIDVSQPLERVKSIIELMNPVAIISIGDIDETLKENCEKDILYYEELLNNDIDYELLERVKDEYLDIDPLYAICTSGSTGVPKGVLVSHRSVEDFIPVFVETFNLTKDDIFGNQAPFDFDVSVKDIYSSLYLGASVYIIPKVCFSMPKKLVEVLEEKKVSTIVWAVSAMCIAAGVNAFKHIVPSSIKTVMFSGEVMPIKMLNIWRKYYPNAVFVNLYGPTEITCNCMYYIIDREFNEDEKLPLGKAFKNEEVFFLNENNQKIKVGETGEICVSGTCLSLGYYNNPSKTNEVFVQNPLNPYYPQLIYKTGDLAYLADDGNYYFSGRSDFQIKHMGHRIELEEIEAHLNAVNKLQRATCLFDTEKNKIVAFYIGDLDKTEIINELKLKIPKYMIPNIFIKIDEFPLTKNGKVDRKLLMNNYHNNNNLSGGQNDKV